MKLALAAVTTVLTVRIVILMTFSAPYKKKLEEELEFLIFVKKGLLIEKKMDRVSIIKHIKLFRFIRLFRITKTMFRAILDDIKDSFPPAKRTSGITLERKLAIALRFYAVGSYQECVGGHILLSVSQATTSKIVSEVTEVLEQKLCPKWIKFPTTDEEKLKLKREFFSKHNISGVIGAVDGTHVNMNAPVSSENIYVNRKGHHSINVMLVSF
jgi:hypothetical protein